MTMIRQNRAFARAVLRPLCVQGTLPGLLLVGAVLLLASVRVVAAQNDELDATIQHLIEYVRQSDVQFERNFSSHDSQQAAEHIESKYQHFRDEIDTPEKFIELCATRSLVTGKAYQVIVADGKSMPAGEWLNLELARYRGGSQQQWVR
mgnify:FL=1|jgi:hypothetical protein